LTILISGPKQPDFDIDVFLEPLMEDIKLLWEEGVTIMDACLKKKFTEKASSLSPSSITLVFFTVGTDQRENQLRSLP
jgi:putative N-acetylmannosamine-6-phosphate epimerase